MKNLKRSLSLIMMCMMLILVSCNNEKEVGKPQDESKMTETTENTTTDVKEVSENSKTIYPLEITTYDQNGDEITTTYEKAPEKVLAVYQGSIETLLALGQADRIVAAAGLDNEVDESMKADFEKLNYLEAFTPPKEDVTILNPDMILSWGSYFGEKTLGNPSDWIEKGTNIYINSNTRRGGYPRTVDNELTDILNLGKIFDVEDKAQKIVDETKAVIDTTIEKTKDQTPSNVMVLEPINGKITNYDKDSIAGDMVTKLGGKLANPDAKEVGAEDIVASNPDVIFVVYMAYSGENGEDVAKTQMDFINNNEALQSVEAIKNKRVYSIMLGDMYASGVRTKNGIENFAKGLYPELDFK